MSRGPRARTVINQTYPEVDCPALKHEARYRHFVIETTVVDALSRLAGSRDYGERSAIIDLRSRRNEESVAISVFLELRAIERELGLANDHASPGDDQHVHCCP